MPSGSSLRRTARARLVDGFTWEHAVTRLVAVMDELCADRGLPAIALASIVAGIALWILGREGLADVVGHRRAFKASSRVSAAWCIRHFHLKAGNPSTVH